MGPVPYCAVCSIKLTDRVLSLQCSLRTDANATYSQIDTICSNFFIIISLDRQSWGLRPRSYDKTGLRLASVLSWSCSFGLGLRRIGLLLVLLPTCVVPDKALCEMIMLKCNKHLYFSYNKCRNSAKRKWPGHFLTFFCTKLFF